MSVTVRVLSSLLFVFLLLCTSFTLAFVSDTAQLTSPLNFSLSRGVISVNVSYDGLANITIEYNTSGSYQPLNVTFNQTGPYNFSWNTSNGSFSDAIYGLRVTVVNSSNATDNETLYLSNLTIGNVAPEVSGFFSPIYPSLPNETISFFLVVDDPIFVSTVILSNGSYNVTILDHDPENFATSTLVIYNFTPQDFGCQNESWCQLMVFANDTANNMNQTLAPYLGPLYLDTNAPQLLQNATNVTTAQVGENLLVSAKWAEISFTDTDYLYVAFERYNRTSSRFTPWALWDYGSATGPDAVDVDGNFTNATYLVGGSDEGETLTFRITANDSNNHTNTTANLTVVIANSSPTFSMRVANGSYLGDTTPIVFTMLDTGVGVNLSTLVINATSAALNTSITYTANSSLFSCSQSYSGITDNATCSLNLSWLVSNVTLLFNVSDRLGNRALFTFTLAIIDAPDIANITVNGASVLNATSESSATISFSNASAQTNVSWSVDAVAAINITTVFFANTTPLAQQRLSVPAQVLYNFTAGKNYLVINTTMNNSPLTDAVQLNITANVPLNIAALAGQYEQGLVDSFRVYNASTDVSALTLFVNQTLDVAVNLTDSSTDVPFWALFNYTNLSGLALRWNISNAFAATVGDGNEESELSNLTFANVTLVLDSAGDNELFFDGARYFVLATFNFSIGNLTPYYQERNASTNRTYLLLNCSSTPSGIVSGNSACYESSANTTTLYLPRFERRDRIFFARRGAFGSNITLQTPTTSAQSMIVVNFSVLTSSPNATFCSYNLSRFNTTTNVSIIDTFAALALSAFTTDGPYWTYTTNITQKINGQYNLSVTCADSAGVTNTTRINIALADTTAPTPYGVTATNIGSDSAHITGFSDEYATFVAKYGTSNTSITSTVNGDDDAGLADNIEIQDLSVGTVYYYYLTACDLHNNCGNSAIGTFTTRDPTSGSSGGGGGGGIEDVGVQGEVQHSTTETHVWMGVVSGQTIEYDTKDLAITHVLLSFIKDVARVQVSIEEFVEEPQDVPELPATAYKYLSISHDGLKENVDRYELTISVPKEWIKTNNVVHEELKLYRLEGNLWVPYELKQIGDHKDSYEYVATVPGFSMFAIGGPSAPVTAAPIDVAPVTPIVETQETPAEPVVQEPTGGFVSALDKSERTKGTPMWLIILCSVIFVSLSGIIGLQQYKEYQKRETQHAARINMEREQLELQKKAVEKPVERPVEHDPMAELHAYISRMRAKNVTDDEIRKRMVAVGWDPDIIDLEMLR